MDKNKNKNTAPNTAYLSMPPYVGTAGSLSLAPKKNAVNEVGELLKREK